MRYNIHGYEGEHQGCSEPSQCDCECKGCKRAYESSGRPRHRDSKGLVYVRIEGVVHTWTQEEAHRVIFDIASAMQAPDGGQAAAKIEPVRVNRRKPAIRRLR